MEIQKIEDRAEARAVDDDADRAAEHQPERAGEKAALGPAQPDEKQDGDADRQRRQQYRRPLRSVAQETEADAPVPDDDRVEETRPRHNPRRTGSGRAGVRDRRGKY